MAPTEGRVAKPERRRGGTAAVVATAQCGRDAPALLTVSYT